MNLLTVNLANRTIFRQSDLVSLSLYNITILCRDGGAYEDAYMITNAVLKGLQVRSCWSKTTYVCFEELYKITFWEQLKTWTICRATRIRLDQINWIRNWSRRSTVELFQLYSDVSSILFGFDFYPFWFLWFRDFPLLYDITGSSLNSSGFYPKSLLFLHSENLIFASSRNLKLVQRLFCSPYIRN